MKQKEQAHCLKGKNTTPQPNNIRPDQHEQKDHNETNTKP